MSRSTMLDSASGGMPRSPSLNDTGPRFMLAPCVMRVSSACWITVSPTRAAAASASRIMPSFRIGCPSSVTATAPADLSAA